MSYVKLVSEFKPDFFLFENVKGLWQTAKHRVFYDKLKSKIRLSGYCITDRLCNAIEFGVPQDRERVMLFGVACEKKTVNGIKKDLVDFPWEDYVLFNAAEVKKADWPDVVDFGFKDTTPVPNDFKTLTVQHWFDKNDVIRHPNASNYFQPRAGLAKMKTIKEGDDSRKSYKRLHRNRYSPTAAYGNNEVHLHPFKPRRISVAEAMAIQSLPKKFELPGDMTLSDMFKTIGNGVPFLLAEAIAKTIRQYLKVTTC
jgi:DNA (cytosine-5)-methyltransferase 1